MIWFVHGGRVLKDESLEDAFSRLIEAELSLLKITSRFKSDYKHFYGDDFYEDLFTTHYFIPAYELDFNRALASLPTEQHAIYKWFD